MSHTPTFWNILLFKIHLCRINPGVIGVENQTSPYVFDSTPVEIQGLED